MGKKISFLNSKPYYLLTDFTILIREMLTSAVQCLLRFPYMGLTKTKEGKIVVNGHLTVPVNTTLLINSIFLVSRFAPISHYFFF